MLDREQSANPQYPTYLGGQKELRDISDICMLYGLTLPKLKCR